MPITNFRIRKMEAERKEGKVEKGKVEAKSNFAITSIKKDKNPNLGEYLEVNFKYDITYEPKVGRINLEGQLWYYRKDLEKVAKIKKGKVELNKESAAEISTTILQRSVIEAIGVAKNLRLPIPLSLPKVNIKQDTLKFNKAS